MHSHVWKTIPFPLLYKFNTLKVPSIYTESISPTMKWSVNPSFSDRLLHSLLCDNLYKAPVVFILSFFLCLLSFDFHRTLFLRAPEFAWAPGIQIYVKFMLNLNTLFKHTFVCLITHSFICVFNSNLGQCFSYVYSISTATFNLMWTFNCM